MSKKILLVPVRI